MKHGILLCCVLLFSVFATAQEESKLHILLNGGLSLPQKSDWFKERWGKGFNVGGGISYRISPRLTLQALVNYDRFPFDEEGFPDQSVDIQGAEVSVVSVSGELKVSFVGDPHKVSPYVIGGGGIAHISTADTTFSLSSDIDLILTPYDYAYGTNPYLDPRDLPNTIEGESETKAMATVGGGVDIPLSERLVIFVEGRYQLYFTSDDRTDFASFRAGVRIGL